MSRELTEKEKIERSVARGGQTFERIEDALGFTEAEKADFVLRCDLAKAVRVIRQAKGLTQAQLAKAIDTRQATVAAIETGGVKTSLDLMFKAYFHLGGTLADLASGNVVPKDVATDSAFGVTHTVVSRVRPKKAAGAKAPKVGAKRKPARAKA